MRRLVLFYVITLFLPACGQDAGSFSLSISWDTKPPGKVWVWGRVEERADPTQSGTILASVGPEEYESSEPFALAMEGVGNGDNRYLIIEVRDGANPTLAILYYGISEAFSLEPGRHTHVDVPMVLQVPEAAAMEASMELLFGGEVEDQVGPTQITGATVRTRSLHATTIMLANDASFSAGVTEYGLGGDNAITCTTDEDGDGIWDLCEVPDWDLTAGLSGELSDEQYTVFVKFLDKYGYESPVYRASVVLDSHGPLVLLASVTPAVARPGTEVFLSVTFHEALDEMDVGGELHPEPALPSGTVVAGPTRVGTSTSYLWTLSLPVDWSGAESFTFLVDSRDRLGNEALQQKVVDQDVEDVTLTIDSLPPLLVADAGAGLSQTLFGLPDEGEKLTFEFVVEEVHPQAVTAGTGGCEGICPAVRLGTAVLGTVSRATELDDGGQNRLGFRYEYEVAATDFAKADSEVEAVVVWTDKAGNSLESAKEGTVHFDFQPPGVMSCSLVPAFGNATSTFTYTLTATEVLAEEPALSVDALTEGLFEVAGSPSDGGQTWHWQQSAQDVDSQTLTVSARLLDLAGNESQGEAGGYLCPRSAMVDGAPPVVGTEGAEIPELWTVPEVLNGAGETVLACGDGDTLHVRFVVTEAAGIKDGYPDVRLAVAGSEISLTQEKMEVLGDNKFEFTYEAALSAAEHFQDEGLWPVRVTVLDESQNEKVVDQLANELVKVDFSPPVAECSLIPSPSAAGYPIGQKVMVLISPLEELEPGSVPLLAEAFEPEFEGAFFSFDQGTKYRFSRVIQNSDGEHDFTIGVGLTDLVGNSTLPMGTACTNGQALSGKADGAAPAAESVTLTVDDGAVDPASTPLRAGSKVTATVAVGGTEIPPSAQLSSGPFSLVSAEPVLLDSGLLEWTLERTLTGTEEQGVQHVAITAVDGAGNTTKVVAIDSPLNLDFTPPVAQCSVFPPNAKMGDVITVTVNTSEPLQPGRPDFEAEGLVFVWPEADPGVTSFDYQHIVGPDDWLVTSWTYEVALTDMAGNPGDGVVCSGGGSIDADPPQIGDAMVWTEPEVLNSKGELVVTVGPDDSVLASLVVTDAQGVSKQSAEVSIEVPDAPVPLSMQSFVIGEDGSAVATFKVIMDPAAHGAAEGTWPLKAVVADLAGNKTAKEGLGGQLVRIDFTPPAAECSLIPVSGNDPYPIGQKILMQIFPHEELQAGSTPAVVETVDPAPGIALFVYDDDSSYSFSHTVSAVDGELDFSVRVTMTDLVGNATADGGNACAGGALAASIDGDAPTVVSVVLAVDGGAVDHSVTPLNAGRVVQATIQVTNTQQEPTVTIGDGTMTATTGTPVDLGNDLYQWVFERTLDGTEGEGEQKVSVSGTDAAGNAYSYLEADATVALDFTAPTAQCTANPAVAALGDLLVVTVTTSEPVLGDLPDFQSTPQMTTTAQPEEGATSFTYTLEVDEFHEGLTEWTYAVNLADPAGNIALDVCSGGGALDAVAPALTGGVLSVDPEVIDAQGQIRLMVGDEDKLYAELSVFETHGITIDEVAIAVYGLAAELDEMAHTDHGDGNHDFVYSLTVDGAELNVIEGSWPVRLVMSDDAGNQTTVASLADRLVTLDFTAPLADCSLVPSPGSSGYGIDQTVTLYVTSLEELALGSTPEVTETFSPDLGEAFFEYEDGSSYRYSGVIGSWATEGNLSAAVELTDLVGNSTISGGNACISSVGAGYDAIRPTVAGGVDGITISRDRVKEDQQFYVAFSLTDGEIVESAPTVTVGNNSMVKNDALSDEDFAFAYAPDLDIEPADEEGIWPLSLILEDGAGNQTVYSPGTVQFDFSGPALSGSTSMFYGQPSGCPLSAVTAVTHGSSLQVFFAVNEVLDSAPQVWAEGDGVDGGTLALSPVGVAEPDQFAFTYILGPGQTANLAADVEGSIQVKTLVTDLAGNPTTLTVAAAVPVDTLAPESPDVDTEGAIVFTRFPWGSDATHGDKAYLLRGEENAVEGGAFVRVYDSVAIEGAMFLGQVTAGGDGSFGAQPGENGAFELVPAPLAQVFVEAVDGACNRSSGDLGTAVGVRDVEWVATMGYKVAGSSAANPHELVVRPWFANSLWRTSDEEAEEPAELGTATGSDLDTEGTSTWRELETEWEEPSKRAYAVSAYDSWRGVLVLYGGASEAGLAQDTWEYDGITWRQVIPTDPEGDGDPGTGVSDSLAMAFDPVRGKTVLYTHGVSQVWEWDGESWMRMVPTDPEGDGEPWFGSSASMVFAPSRDECLLLEHRSSNDKTKLWSWDGVSFQLLDDLDSTDPTKPSARRNSTVGFDLQSGKLFVFGGLATDAVTLLADTWTWDGDEWEDVTPASPSEEQPVASRGAVAAYDALNEWLLMYGGYYNTGSSARLWAWTGTEWTQLDDNPGGLDPNKPPRVAFASLEWDARREVLVLFGGTRIESGGLGATEGIFEWWDSAWANRTLDGVDSAPPSRSEMVYFPPDELLLLHSDSNAVDYEETWEFSPSGWRSRDPDTVPPGRNRFSLACQGGADERVLLFGGYDNSNTDLNDLWAWDGSDWSMLFDSSPNDPAQPSPRFGAGMEWDSTREIVVLFSGADYISYDTYEPYTDTWELDGAAWSQVDLTGPDGDPEGDGEPVGRVFGALAHDPGTGVTALLNGVYNPGEYSQWHDHWLFTGSSWLMRASETGFDAESLPFVYRTTGQARRVWRSWYDPVMQDVVAMGHMGVNYQNPLEVWRWSGTDWQQIAQSDPDSGAGPSNRTEFAVEYLPSVSKTVLFGGRTGAAAWVDDTWYFDRGTGQRPGQVIRISLAEAGVDDTSLYTGIEVTWHAGGTGTVAGVEASGARLLVWDGGAFAEKATNDSPAGSQTALTWSSEDEDVLVRLPVTDDLVLGAAVTPMGTNWCEYAEVTSSYLEVVLSYRLEE